MLTTTDTAFDLDTAVHEAIAQIQRVTASKTGQRIYQALPVKGGVATVTEAILGEADGFDRVVAAGGLGLTLEFHVVNDDHWRPLFDPTTVRVARDRVIAALYTRAAADLTDTDLIRRAIRRADGKLDVAADAFGMPLAEFEALYARRGIGTRVPVGEQRSLRKGG